MKNAFVCVIASVAFSVPAISANAVVVGFDDLPVASLVPSPYDGFIWDNFYVVGTGYEFPNGVVSPSHDAFDLHAAPSSISRLQAFTFNSGYFTSADYTGDMNVTDNLGDSKTFTINTVTPTFETFNWVGVNQVNIVRDGIDIFVVDNLTLNGVPEPATWSLMLVGLGCLGAATRASATRRRSQG